MRRARRVEPFGDKTLLPHQPARYARPLTRAARASKIGGSIDRQIRGAWRGHIEITSAHTSAAGVASVTACEICVLRLAV